jgi:hypothetical protein
MIDNFIPEIWSKKVLIALYAKLVAMNLVNRDYEGDIAAGGDTVRIISPADITVETDDGNEFSWQDLTDAQKQLLIDQAKRFHFQVKDIAKAQANVNIQDVYTQNAAQKMAEAIDKDVLQVMALGAHSDNAIGSVASGSEFKLTSSNAYDTFLKIAANLSKKNVPMTGRFAALGPDDISVILSADISQRSTQLSDQAISNGVVARLAGFDIFESNNLYVPTSGVATDDAVARHIVYGHPMATTVAMQIANVKAVEVEKGFGIGVKGQTVYGRKVIRPEAIGVVYQDTDKNGSDL